MLPRVFSWNPPYAAQVVNIRMASMREMDSSGLAASPYLVLRLTATEMENSGLVAKFWVPSVSEAARWMESQLDQGGHRKEFYVRALSGSRLVRRQRNATCGDGITWSRCMQGQTFFGSLRVLGQEVPEMFDAVARVLAWKGFARPLWR